MSAEKIRKATRFAGQTVSQRVRDPLNEIPPFVENPGHPSSLTGFMSTVRASGLSYPNRFEVIVTPPAAVAALLNERGFSSTSLDLREITYRIANAEIPGRSVATIEHRTTSTVRKLPYTQNFNEITLSMIMSESMYERNLFDAWQDVIYNRATNDVEYYDDHVGTIQIRSLSRADGIVKSVKLFEAYPTIVSPIELGYDNNNNVSRQAVTFTFHRWESEGSAGSVFPTILTPPEFRQFIQELGQEINVFEDTLNIFDDRLTRTLQSIP